MYNILTIFIGKMVVIAGIIFRRGSSLPGVISLKMNKKILKFFKIPKTVIAVTGSSGKGSISSLLAKIFEEQGYSVAHNKVGSNLTPAIVTLLLENCSLTGKIKKNVLIYEIDEKYTKYVFNDIVPNYLVISNISRDQPPRQGHFDKVALEIKKAINPNMHLILNGDDPILRKFVDKNKVTYYGIDKNKYSYTKNKFMNLNLSYCPLCNNKLEYNYYNFESIGSYYCPKCDFKKPINDYKVTNINYEKNEITIDNKFKIKLPYTVLYNIYNNMAAFACASVIGLNKEKISKTIESYTINKKIFNTYQYTDRIITVLNNKNENSSTFNQSLLYVSRFKEIKTIVIGWKEISRRYNFDDLSWLYDIDFELLRKANIDKIVCSGIHRYDIATRLKYAGIDEKNIVVFDELKDTVLYIKEKTKGNIYAILNFDYVNPFNRLMKGSEL